jgi:hypothetical protein
VVEFYRKLAHFYGALPWSLKVGLVVGVTVLTTAGAMAVLVWLPPDHFNRARREDRRHVVLRWTLKILKNLLGLVVLPLGIVMALPLVPGPGLVFILIGLSLLDFPGKRALERRLLGRPSVLRYINEVRARFGRGPLVVEPE